MKTRTFLTFSLALLLWWTGTSYAGEADLYGSPTERTPYDRKSALTEALIEPAHPPHSPIGSIDGFFRQARRFVYIKEKNRDDWQFPQETEKRQAGDCEDKALWLYARLRAAGYKDLRLVVGKYQGQDIGYHMWLMHTDTDGNITILDPTIQTKIWPLHSFHQGLYRSVYLFDGKHRYRSFLEPHLQRGILEV